MEDVIEALREAAIDVPVPLELPEYDDLVVIEEQILIPLPDDFKDFLLEVSDVVYGTLEPATVMDPLSHTYLPELAAQAWDIGLPRDLIPVCEARGGYYAINEGGEVSYWRNGNFSDDEWPSIWHWAKEVWLEEGQ